MSKSPLEALLAFQITAAKLPRPAREFQFDPPRRWKFDFCWPERLLAVEVEGGAWSRGRHTRGLGFTSDCEKYSAAAILGWRIIRATGEHVKSGEALAWIERALRKAA